MLDPRVMTKASTVSISNAALSRQQQVNLVVGIAIGGVLLCILSWTLWRWQSQLRLPHSWHDERCASQRDTCLRPGEFFHVLAPTQPIYAHYDYSRSLPSTRSFTTRVARAESSCCAAESLERCSGQQNVESVGVFNDFGKAAPWRPQLYEESLSDSIPGSQSSSRRNSEFDSHTTTACKASAAVCSNPSRDHTDSINESNCNECASSRGDSGDELGTGSSSSSNAGTTSLSSVVWPEPLKAGSVSVHAGLGSFLSNSNIVNAEDVPVSEMGIPLPTLEKAVTIRKYWAGPGNM